MKLPRDIGGKELAQLLERNCDYKPIRQAGSHLRMTSKRMGEEHHITIPLYDPLKPGMLNGLLIEVASYLKISKRALLETLF